jgi:hypothetical protein
MIPALSATDFQQLLRLTQYSSVAAALRFFFLPDGDLWISTL